jgi:hypothetical protein
MQCPGCGNVVDLAAAFCGRCGQRLNHDIALRGPARRPAVITMLAVFQFLGGATWMFLGVAVLSAFRVVPQETQASGVVVSALIGFGFLGFGILQIAGGVGLLKLKGYGRSILRFFSILGLLGFPVGTVISIVILVYLNTPGVKLLFSERPVQELSPTEYAQLVAAAQSSTAARVVVIVGVLVVGVFALGIVAAILVPGLLRARLASNEAAAIGMLRTFAAAERGYASANGGR